MTRYCYSLDGEEFHGDYETRGDALANGEHEARCSGDFDPGPATVYTGERQEALDLLREHADYIGQRVVDALDEWLADEIASDDQIIKLPGDKLIGFGAVIIDYLAQHCPPMPCNVTAVQKHAITIPEDE